MKYTYRIYREAWLDIDVEADNEDDAQDKFDDLEFDGKLVDAFKLAVQESETRVAEVWEGGIEDGLCIYSIY